MNDFIAMDAYNTLQNNPSLVRIHESLNDYVISRGARDCSILITIREVSKQTAVSLPSCFMIELISFQVVISLT